MSAKQPIWPAGSQSMAVIFGTQGRDFLEGTGQDDVIQGWAKFGDQLTDLGDELRAGDARGGDGDLRGGADDDLKGGGGDSFGGPGDDQLSGGDTLRGGRGDDTLRADGDDDVLTGGTGGDTLRADGGNDLL